MSLGEERSDSYSQKAMQNVGAKPTTKKGAEKVDWEDGQGLGQWSQAVAIEVYFPFEPALFL